MAQVLHTPVKSRICGDNFVGGWVDPRVGLDSVKKKNTFLLLPGFKS
jgi:hypothetical protein